MSSSRQATIPIIPDLDLSNYSITNQLAYFIEEYLTDHDDSDSLREELEADDAGHCQGLTTLVLYALWLEAQPKRLDVMGAPIPRDDWTWLQNTVNSLTTWDSESPMKLTVQDQHEFERLLYIIEFFQNTYKYMQSAEGDLHVSLSDTRNRKIHFDYGISGLFHPTDLYKPLRSGHSFIEELAKPNNLVIIGSDYHVVGVISLDNVLYFYDSQYAAGTNVQVLQNQELKKLAEFIFKSLHKDAEGRDSSDKYATLDFRVFSFEPGKKYESQRELLLQTKAVQTEDVLRSYNNLFNLSAKMGDNNSIMFYKSALGDDRTLYRLRQEVEGWGALHHATSNGRLLSSLALIGSGAYTNKRTSGGKGDSPLYLATLSGSTSVMQLLLQNNAVISLSNSNGNKAIHAAVIKNKRDALFVLYEWGADINDRNDLQETPLLIAVSMNNIDIARLLLEMGSDVNLCNNTGYTPLHIAAENNNVEMVRLLINYNADIHAKLPRKRREPKHLTEDDTITQLLQDSRPASSSVPLVSRIILAMQGIRNENIRNAEAFLHINMNGEIVPDLVFKKTGILDLALPEALYIEAIHELFQEAEAIDEIERRIIIEKINQLVEDKDLISFIDIPQSEIKKFLKDIVPIVGEESPLHKRILWQQKAKYKLDNFKKECSDLEIDAVHIGGVYGKACVWDAARQLGENIYAKNVGDKHPNIRYADVFDEFQFKNVYIDDTITQGFMGGDLDTFDEFVLFPQYEEPFYLENVTAPGTVEAFEDENAETPDEIGAGYDNNYSEVNNPEKHEKLVTQMRSLLFENGLNVQQADRNAVGLFRKKTKRQKVDSSSESLSLPTLKR